MQRLWWNGPVDSDRPRQPHRQLTHLHGARRLAAWLDYEDRLAAAERRRGLGLVVGTLRRFLSIDGFDLAGLVSLELFLTVFPITIVGYAVLAPAKARRSVGELMARQLHLSGDNATLVIQTFGDSASLRSAYDSVSGILGFVIWGIPMSFTVTRVFIKAWRRADPRFWSQVWRGACWFSLYLVASFGSDVVEQTVKHTIGRSLLGFVVGMAAGLLPLIVLWAASHPILVPDAGWDLAAMTVVGLSGAVLNGLVLRLTEVAAFPSLMSWWTGFGPLGVAMTLLTWSLVQGVGWVLTACLGAVLVERHVDPALSAGSSTSR